jgi:tetratricopeptide (TPR) repeat protein
MARKEDQGRPLPPSQNPVHDSGNNKLQHMESPPSDAKALDEQQQIIHMAENLQERREFAKEKQFLLDVIKKDPRKAYALDRLGWLCLILGRGPEAVIYLSKSLILNPENNWALKGLGAGYNGLHHYASAEAALKKSIAIAPKDEWSYVELATTYSWQGRYGSAEVLLREGIRRCDRKDTLYGALARINLMTGKKDENPISYSMSNYYTNETVRNYKALNSILKRRKIVLVCVQYPMRSLVPLEAIFDDKSNIFFVDNERIFKDAVMKNGFWEYFTDSFGGDFGHCKEKGNRLLAENIAKVILKEVVKK